MSKKDYLAKWKNLYRIRARTDLFWLLTDLLNRGDARHPFILERCNQVQLNPDGNLDLWAREHYKSTIITFAYTIQDILFTHGRDSTEEYWCFAIFSYVRPIAKDFLIQIKREFEINHKLIYLFDDVLWDKPHTQAPKWSDEAIEVKRPINRRESTVEAWGVYEGQPVSKHFDVRIYDDMVTQDTVKTPERIDTTVKYWELSLSLASSVNIERYLGTRYAFSDPYHTILEREAVNPRFHPATDDGTFQGTPVFWTQEFFESKVRSMGRDTASAQLLQNPVADSSMGFREEDLRYYDGISEQDRKDRFGRLPLVLIVDPSSGKRRKRNDFTSMGVYALGKDRNYYLVDGVRDKLKLTERADKLFSLHELWEPNFVFYEDSGLSADIDHIKDRMEREAYHFEIVPLSTPPNVPKIQRILVLQPLFENHRIWYPRTLKKQIKDGRVIDIIQVIKFEEYLVMPVPVHDDWYDMESRLRSPEVTSRVRFPTKNSGLGPKKLPVEEVYA